MVTCLGSLIYNRVKNEIIPCMGGATSPISNPGLETARSLGIEIS
ncbi:MAG: hypothetical protein ACTSWN_15695 [Promethearchaeota archaeon]